MYHPEDEVAVRQISMCCRETPAVLDHASMAWTALIMLVAYDHGPNVMTRGPQSGVHRRDGCCPKMLAQVCAHHDGDGASGGKRLTSIITVSSLCSKSVRFCFRVPTHHPRCPVIVVKRENVRIAYLGSSHQKRLLTTEFRSLANEHMQS
jgi:hypothetical protein